jgi:hypothetical protein
MRYKPVPPARDRDRLLAVRDALPLRPAGEADWRVRLGRVAGEGTPEEWLTFLIALGLAERTDLGVRRLRDEPGRDALAEAFLAKVFLAREVVAALGEESDDGRNGDATTDAVFEAVRGAVPPWERGRHADWEREYRERVRRLLGWAEVFGLVAARDEPTGSGPASDGD